MRIGIDTTSWTNRRGFGRFVRELVGALASLGNDDEYVLLADRQTAERVNFPDNCRVLIGDTSVAAAEAAAANGRRSLADMLTMRQLAKRVPLDLVFFPAVYSYFPVGGNVPCIVTFHDVIAETLPHLIFESARSRIFWRLKCRLALHRSSCAITVSQASKQGLMNVFGLNSSRVHVVSEAPSEVFRPVDSATDAHRRVLERYGIRPDDRFFLYVGGISPHKNIQTLIRAFAQLKAEPGPSTRLVIVGDYAGDVFRTCYTSLVEEARTLGASDDLLFTGFVPDEELVHLYASTEAFVFPSYLEGFGLPVVEAMACGAPVIASDRGSLPEVLDGAGHLFDPHDVEPLAAAMSQVINDRAYRQQLVSRSLARAKDFSWEKSARQAVEIFHRFRP